MGAGSRRKRSGTANTRAPDARLPGTPARPGHLVALELDPAPSVQAVWWSRPASRAMPLVIAGPDNRVLAACPLAAATGITAGQSTAQARLRHPEIVIAPPDHEGALLIHETMLATASSISPLVEDAGPATGLAYLEARGLERLWGDAGAVARKALAHLAEQAISARAGAGPSRLLALVLARNMGPDGPRALSGHDARDFLYALPISDPALALTPFSAGTLRELGITTAGALAALPATGLALRFGPDVMTTRRRIDDVAGSGEPPLRAWSLPDVIEVTHALEAPLDDALGLDALLAHLGERLAARLVERGQALSTLTLRLICADGSRHVRRSWHRPPLQAVLFLTVAVSALLARCRLTAAVESVALEASGLCTPETRQHGLWDEHVLARRQERLATILSAQARRHGQRRMLRLRRDPLSVDGWAWEDVEQTP